MLERIVFRWRGVLLSLIGIAATLWLGWSNQLGLYIHPRYFLFTMITATIAGVLVLAAFALMPLSGDDGHDGEPDEHLHDQRRWPVLAASASALLVVAASVGLLVLPAASLSTGGVTAADLSTGTAVGAALEDPQTLIGGDYASFTVKDWSALLRQGVDEQFLAGKEADVIGFVTPDESDPENLFYLARFAVTCCAVDAQPVGIAVYSPGWSDEIAANDWVRVTGGFIGNPSTSSATPIVLDPQGLEVIDEPSEPYVY